jgi:hypothetical protein
MIRLNAYRLTELVVLLGGGYALGTVGVWHALLILLPCALCLAVIDHRGEK